MKIRRQNEILKLLAKEQTLKTEQLASLFDVSIETIRRDIRSMERSGLIKKVYGGISLCSGAMGVATLDSWNTRLEHSHREKAKIAAGALELIEDNMVIALDIGTTVYELSRLLGTKKNLSIITNSLLMAAELSQNTAHSIYCIGGKVTTNEGVTSGFYARNFLSSFASVDLFLMGADGLSLQYGVTEFSEGVVDVKRQLVSMARRNIVLADHTKFGREALFRSCDLSQIHTLITDEAAPAKELEALRKLGTEVIVI